MFVCFYEMDAVPLAALLSLTWCALCPPPGATDTEWWPPPTPPTPVVLPSLTARIDGVDIDFCSVSIRGESHLLSSPSLDWPLRSGFCDVDDAADDAATTAGIICCKPINLTVISSEDKIPCDSRVLRRSFKTGVRIPGRFWRVL